jgi:hypothetical protein
MCFASRGTSHPASTRVLPFSLGVRDTRCRLMVGSENGLQPASQRRLASNPEPAIIHLEVLLYGNLPVEQPPSQSANFSMFDSPQEIALPRQPGSGFDMKRFAETRLT